jgi:hypothetical protein
MADPADREIATLAKRQRGWVTRRQLLALGESRYEVDYRVKAGRLIAVYAGVYAVGHLPTLPQDRAFGALLACGQGALLSHGSAAAVWGVFKRWELPFEVTAGSARRRAGIRVHRAVLTRMDVTNQLGLRVTSPARTVLDVAPRLTDKALARAVSQLRQSQHLRLADLAELLHRVQRHPARKRLLPFVERPTGPTRSEFEDAFIAFAERFGLPRPLVNTRVCGFEVDALFPAQRLIVELDGWDFHSSREAFMNDRDRDAELLVRGYQTVRITWERLRDTPEREAKRLLAILARCGV